MAELQFAPEAVA